MNQIERSDSQTPSPGSSQTSTAFRYCLSVLLDEIQLAIQWNRPSILLAVNRSKVSQVKAQRALQEKLLSLPREVLYLRPGEGKPDLFQTIEQLQEPDRHVFFVEGLGVNKDSYRALNLRREELVEKKLVTVFWLTETEAQELPRYAPDFWAFRHRVLEFAAGRGPRTKSIPAGLLLWNAEASFGVEEELEQKIEFQESLLHGLPSGGEALAMHADTAYNLANLYWLQGSVPKAGELLHEELIRMELFPVPEIVARLWNGLAILSFERGEYEQSAASFEKASELHPANQAVAVNLAISSHALGRSQQAVVRIRKAIKSAPHSAGLWYILGYIHFTLGQLDMALSSFEESVRCNADLIAASYAIQICQTQIGHTEDSIKMVQLPQPLEGRARFYHAICGEALRGNREAALASLHAAVQDGTISLTFVKRDPTLHMLFDPMVLDALGLIG